MAWAFINLVDETVTPLIPAQYNPETYLPFSIPGLGLLVLLISVTLIGAMTAGLLGRYLVRTGEGLLNRMPVIRSVYNATKQIFETVLAQQSQAFREAVLVEYPRRGIWAIGFITGTTKEEVQNLTAEETVNIFLPTTPNPTSGFLLFVPRKDVVHLDMAVEDAIKMVISGGHRHAPRINGPKRRSARRGFHPPPMKIWTCCGKRKKRRFCCPKGASLARANKPHRRIPLEQIQQCSQGLAPLVPQAGIAVENQLRVVPGGGEQVAVNGQIGDAELGQAALPGAQEFAGAPEPQVLLGDPEAVFGFTQDFEPRPGGLGQARRRRAAGRWTVCRSGRCGREADAVGPTRSVRRARPP